jgi:hypothetical protein
MRTTILIGPQRSRALSAFVAVASDRRVLTPVRGPVTVLLMVGGASIGYLYGTWTGLCLGLAVGLMPGPVLAGLSRSFVSERVRWLDRRRRWVGLDRTLSSDLLALLESAAEDWERIDNAMQSQAWKQQSAFAPRVAEASEMVMGSLIEEALDGREPKGALTLRQLASCVDAVSAAMGGYERPQFDSPGVAIDTGIPQVADLELLLRTIEEDL